MEQHFRQRVLPIRLAQAAWLAIALGTPLVAGNVQAQAGGSTLSVGDTAWQRCANLTDDREARLGCFDRWAAEQARVVSPTPSTVGAVTPTPPAHDCRSPEFSELSRFWELEAGSDCGALNIRGYRPISLSWIGADSVNAQPDSPSAGRTATAKPYSPSETRIQLSVRTKIAQGLLTREQPLLRDSLWFGYTQQSNWQLFNGNCPVLFAVRTTNRSSPTSTRPMRSCRSDGGCVTAG